jgi:hypothetical protein
VIRPEAAAAAAAACLLACTAFAGTFQGDATTIFRVYDLVHDADQLDGVQRVRTYRPLDQYLRLSWDQLGAREGWSVDVSLRGRVDLASGKEGVQEDFQVLHAHATWRSPRGTLDLSFGRLRSVVGLGWHAFDGARLDFRRLRRAQFFVQAGLPIPLGENEEPDWSGFTWGAGATFIAPEHGRLGFDYELRRFDGVTTEETLGVDAELSAGRFELAANADYSVPNDRFGETAAVLRCGLARAQFLEARFTRVEPVLPTDSIFAVFTINAYSETRLSWERRGPKGLDVGAFVSWEDYEDTGLEGEQDIQRAAATMRHEGSRRARHRGELGWQSGWSGDDLALRYDVDLDVTARLRVGGGVSVSRYENAYRLDEEDEEAVLRARVWYDHFGRWDLAIGIDQYWGRDRDTTRGQLVFRTKLGAARRERPWWGGHWGAAWAGGSAPRAEAGDAPAKPAGEALR